MTLSYHLLIPARALTLISVLGVTSLIGCQTTGNDNNIPITAKVATDVDKVNETANSAANDYTNFWNLTEPATSVLNRYNWRLVRWIDNQDLVTEIVSEQPVILDVRPNNLVFNYGCERYRIVHSEIIEGKYSSHAVSNITLPSCLNDKKQPALNSTLLAEQLQSASVESYLNSTFAPFSRSRFSYELLTLEANSYQLALKLSNKTLVFTGTIKSLQPTLGLPITHDFLKSYQWRLVSAVDSKQQTINELTRSGYPISAYFSSPLYDLEENLVGFSADCNGVGGQFVLTADHILLIGMGSQTMMGCGSKREAAEDKIRELEQLSKSQLTLEQLSNANVDDPSLPYYLLTQKLDTGETLIWKNQKIITR